MLIWLDMKIQLPVLIWWTSFWFQKPPTSLCDVHWNCYPGSFPTRARVLWVAQQWAGHHWQSFVTCHHQKTWQVGKCIPETKEVQVRSKLQKKKRRTESHKGQQIHPWVYSSFLHLGFSAPVFESQCSLWGEKVCWRTNSSKGFIGQKYLLKIFKVAGENEKARKGGSGSALSKENVWTEWGKNVGENWADLRINLFLTPFTKN